MFKIKRNSLKAKPLSTCNYVLMYTKKKAHKSKAMCNSRDKKKIITSNKLILEFTAT